MWSTRAERLERLREVFAALVEVRSLSDVRSSRRAADIQVFKR
jgi:hypothetical protein